MEQVRVDNRTYVARTLAAAAANMSYDYLTQLLARGDGPEECFIMWRDGKQFLELKAVKRWAKARPWIKPRRGRRMTSPYPKQAIELTLPRHLVAEFRSRHHGKKDSLSKCLTELLEDFLAKERN